MTDLENFKDLLLKCRSKPNFNETTILDPHEDWITSETMFVIEVWDGYLAHFEASFDKDGNMLNIGQFGGLWCKQLERPQNGRQ